MSSRNELKTAYHPKASYGNNGDHTNSEIDQIKLESPCFENNRLTQCFFPATRAVGRHDSARVQLQA